jgi:hypothetical protein
MNDYSEVTSTLKTRMTQLDDMLEWKEWAAANSIISDLRSDFAALQMFVMMKELGGK